MTFLKTIWTWVKNALQAVLLLLPDSPFIFLDSDYIPEEIQRYLPTLNWLFGVSSMVSILEIWLSAVIVYYAYQCILRWVKAIE